MNGETFDSQKEAERWGHLQLLVRAGYISDLQRQVPFDIVVNKMKVCTYIADAVYRDHDQKLIVEDTKGYKKGAAYQMFQLKAKLLLATQNIRVLET